jgi:hypothetical protein
LAPFVDGNQHLLALLTNQLNILAEHNKACYCHIDQNITGASIGEHVRHIIDFYSCLVNGVEKGVVDYDQRDRDLSLETDLALAIETISNVNKSLSELGTSVNVNVAVSGSIDIDDETPLTYSNIARELQSLHSHTTHHMAIIAILLRTQGFQIDSQFGKAPSTIIYENNLC